MEGTEEADSAVSMCGICTVSKSRYLCPRCNVPYCSLLCYRRQEHLVCSEAFYHDQVVQELSSRSGEDDVEGRQKMQEILMNLHSKETSSGHVDSDDYEDEDEEEDELSARLSGVDLNDADALWQHLSSTERADFENLLRSGEITKVLPAFTPWWEIKNRPVEEVSCSSKTPENGDNEGDISNSASGSISMKDENSGNVEADIGMENSDSYMKKPVVAKDVPPFTELFKKTVSPCVPFNVVNMVAAYVFTVRCFNGEHLDWASHAAHVAWSLSGTLNCNQNYSSVMDAIASAIVKATENEGCSKEDSSGLRADVHCILTLSSVPNAMSDLLMLFRAALRHRPPTAKGPFSQRFPDGADIQLPRDKLKLAVKKVEFYLSWLLQPDRVLFHLDLK